MMRVIVILLVLMSMVSSVLAIPTNDTNIARDISKSIKTTFQNTGGIFDGVADSDPQFSAKSGSLYNVVQEIKVKLSKPFYVRQIKVFWDKDSYYDAYNLQTSAMPGTLYNVEREFMTVEEKGNSIIHTYDLGGSLVEFLRVAVKGNAKDKIKAGPVILQEIEVYPQMDNRVELDTVQTIVTDTEAFVFPQTNIQAASFFKYREAGATTDHKTGGYGRLREAASAVGLTSGMRYDYYVETKDFNANVFKGPDSQFTTKPESLAKGAKITGTFASEVKATENVLIDGNLEIFSNSGGITDNDQELVIDLGSEKPVGSIVVFWRRLAYSRDYSLLGSVDGKGWIELAKNINAQDGLLGRTRGSVGGSPMRVKETGFAPQNLRYVKLLVAKDSDFYHKHTTWDYVQIYEIKVF
jgi:F5/8 type C domain-containing protein